MLTNCLLRSSFFFKKFSFKMMMTKRAATKSNFALVKLTSNIPKRTFCQTSLNLDQQEAYLMNEHDRMVIQLTSSVVPTTALPKFMKELLQILLTLNKYKSFMNGWDYAAKFFHENLKNFNKEDLEFFLFVFSVSGYMGFNDSFWSDAGKEVLSRNLDRTSLISLMNNFILVKMDTEFWSGMVRKAEALDNLTYNDYISLATFLGVVDFPPSDPIWETILKHVENAPLETTPMLLTFILRAANSLKTKVQRDSSFYENVRNYFSQNVSSIPADFIPNFLTQWAQLKKADVSECVSILIETFPLVQKATEFSKLEFYKVVMSWCLEYPNLRTALQNSRIGDNFHVPSGETISAFERYQNETKGKEDIVELETIHQNFWSQHAQSIGFNTAKATTLANNGVGCYETLAAVEKNLKLE